MTRIVLRLQVESAPPSSCYLEINAIDTIIVRAIWPWLTELTHRTRVQDRQLLMTYAYTSLTSCRAVLSNRSEQVHMVRLAPILCPFHGSGPGSRFASRLVADAPRPGEALLDIAAASCCLYGTSTDRGYPIRVLLSCGERILFVWDGISFSRSLVNLTFLPVTGVKTLLLSVRSTAPVLIECHLQV